MKRKLAVILICIAALAAFFYTAACLLGAEPLLVSAEVKKKHEVMIRSEDIYFASGEIAQGLLQEIPLTDQGRRNHGNAFRVANPLAMGSLCSQTGIGSSSRRAWLLARPELMLHYNPVYFVNRGVLAVSVVFGYQYPRPSISSVVREGSRLTVTIETMESVVGTDAEWQVVILIGMDKAELAGVREVEIVRESASENSEKPFSWDPFWGVKSQEWLEKNWEG